jgi:hypothetical protein
MPMSISTYEAITELLLAKPGDTEEMRWALETANAVWTSGDHREALRWLRRAAEIASEEGLDLRAVGLARIAAELRGELDLPPTVPPPPDSHARIATPKIEPLPPPPSPAVAIAKIESIPPLPRPAVSTDPGFSPTLDTHSSPAPVPPPAVEESSESPGKFQVLRVVVRANTDGTLSAAPCAPDAPTPAGFRPALVIALDPGVDLLS